MRARTRFQNQSGLGCRGIFLIGLLLFVAFSVFRIYQYKKHLEENPPVMAPGQVAFESAEDSIGRNAGTTTFGNTAEAKRMAGAFSKQMSLLRSEFFTAGEESTFSLTDGAFLTHCNLLDNKAVFLVHVPQLRKFADDAQDSLCELAWLCANQILLDAGHDESTELAVGVKGIVNYAGIWTGTVTGGEDPLEGIKRKADGFGDRDRFHRFYVASEPEAPEPAESDDTTTSEPAPAVTSGTAPGGGAEAAVPVANPEN